MTDKRFESLDFDPMPEATDEELEALGREAWDAQTPLSEEDLRRIDSARERVLKFAAKQESLPTDANELELLRRLNAEIAQALQDQDPYRLLRVIKAIREKSWSRLEYEMSARGMADSAKQIAEDLIGRRMQSLLPPRQNFAIGDRVMHAANEGGRGPGTVVDIKQNMVVVIHDNGTNPLVYGSCALIPVPPERKT